MMATKKDNAEELLPLVDEKGYLVGAATRGECHDGSKKLHPVVHLHIFNSRGELFLQKRPAWKDIQPGKWDTAVGGHMDLGENAMQALKREAMEEVGIDLDAMPVEMLPKGELPSPYVFTSDKEQELVYTYRVTTDVIPSPSKETDGGRFWNQKEIVENLGKGVFTPNFEREYENLLRHEK